MNSSDYFEYAVGTAVLILAVTALILVLVELGLLALIFKWIKNLKP